MHPILWGKTISDVEPVRVRAVHTNILKCCHSHISLGPLQEHQLVILAFQASAGPSRITWPKVCNQENHIRHQYLFFAKQHRVNIFRMFARHHKFSFKAGFRIPVLKWRGETACRRCPGFTTGCKSVRNITKSIADQIAADDPMQQFHKS